MRTLALLSLLSSACAALPPRWQVRHERVLERTSAKVSSDAPRTFAGPRQVSVSVDAPRTELRVAVERVLRCAPPALAERDVTTRATYTPNWPVVSGLLGGGGLGLLGSGWLLFTAQGRPDLYDQTSRGELSRQGSYGLGTLLLGAAAAAAATAGWAIATDGAEEITTERIFEPLPDSAWDCGKEHEGDSKVAVRLWSGEELTAETDHAGIARIALAPTLKAPAAGPFAWVQVPYAVEQSVMLDQPAPVIAEQLTATPATPSPAVSEPTPPAAPAVAETKPETPPPSAPAAPDATAVAVAEPLPELPPDPPLEGLVKPGPLQPEVATRLASLAPEAPLRQALGGAEPAPSELLPIFRLDVERYSHLVQPRDNRARKEALQGTERYQQDLKELEGKRDELQKRQFVIELDAKPIKYNLAKRALEVVWGEGVKNRAARSEGELFFPSLPGTQLAPRDDGRADRLLVKMPPEAGIAIQTRKQSLRLLAKFSPLAARELGGKKGRGGTWLVEVVPVELLIADPASGEVVFRTAAPTAN